MIDHTLLHPEASRPDIVRLCREASDFGCASVCVNPSRVALASALLSDCESKLQVCTVIGFPFGATLPRSKAEEVVLTRRCGASEFDVVINLGAVMDGLFKDIRAELDGVCKAAEGDVVKVIIEAGALTDSQIRAVCDVVLQTTAAFVKTSTGFHRTGGAMQQDIRTIREAVGNTFGIKAAGGIRRASDAIALLGAGATRLGLSATATVLAEVP